MVEQAMSKLFWAVIGNFPPDGLVSLGMSIGFCPYIPPFSSYNEDASSYQMLSSLVTFHFQHPSVEFTQLHSAQ